MKNFVKPRFSRGIAEFTLDYGKCPPWLFKRMVKLAKLIIYYIREEFEPEEFIRRLADPVWFQSFGCVLAFDWNASGLTTTTLGAIKVVVKEIGEEDLGIFVCGGKGKTSRKTPEEILNHSYRLGFSQKRSDTLVKISRLSAKVDSSLIQDGFQIYHHNFIFTKSGEWTVIQQGMNTTLKRARRYHWHSNLIRKDLTESPHTGISSEVVLNKCFNLILEQAKKNKQMMLKLVQEKKDLLVEVKRLKNYDQDTQLSLLSLSSKEFSSHPIQKEKSFKEVAEFLNSKRFDKSVKNLINKPISNFEDLLLTENIGPKTVRALSLITEIITGAKPSYEDPIRYTYAFGGKDGIPYPVETKLYDKIIQIMERAVKKSSLSLSEKNTALKQIEKHFLNQ